MQKEPGSVGAAVKSTAFDRFDKLVGPRALMAAVTTYHAQIKRAAALEAAMLPQAELP